MFHKGQLPVYVKGVLISPARPPGPGKKWLTACRVHNEEMCTKKAIPTISGLCTRLRNARSIRLNQPYTEAGLPGPPLVHRVLAAHGGGFMSVPTDTLCSQEKMN